MADVTQMCDFYPERPATHQFQASWGVSGFTSMEGMQLLRQQRDNMNGGPDAPMRYDYSLAPLAGAPAPAVTRDERARLMADKLAAEAERDQTAERCTRLLTRDADLSAQLNNERELKVELSAQLTDARSDLEKERSSRDNYAAMVSKLEKQVADQNQILQLREDSRAQLTDAQKTIDRLQADLALTNAELEKQRARANELAEQNATLRAPQD